MTTKRIRIMWARKLLGAKHFVVMTDKESALMFEGIDPREFTDALALAAQAAELEAFQESLTGLMLEHKDAIDKLGVKSDKSKKKGKTTTRKNTRKL